MLESDALDPATEKRVLLFKPIKRRSNSDSTASASSAMTISSTLILLNST
jgi:hypothetical protein